MKRRDFLKMLGIGAAVAAVAPAILSNPSVKVPYQFPSNFCSGDFVINDRKPYLQVWSADGTTLKGYVYKNAKSPNI